MDFDQTDKFLYVMLVVTAILHREVSTIKFRLISLFILNLILTNVDADFHYYIYCVVCRSIISWSFQALEADTATNSGWHSQFQCNFSDFPEFNSIHPNDQMMTFE